MARGDLTDEQWGGVLEALAPPILPLLTRPGGTPAGRSSTHTRHTAALATRAW